LRVCTGLAIYVRSVTTSPTLTTTRTGMVLAAPGPKHLTSQSSFFVRGAPGLLGSHLPEGLFTPGAA